MTSKKPEILELSELVRIITPPKKIQTNGYLDEGNFPIVDQSLPVIAGWTEDETALVHPSRSGLIIFGDHTCVLKFVTSSFAQGADGIKIIEVKEGINAHYVYAHLLAFPLLNDGYKRHFSELKRLKIRIPESSTQHAISKFLHTIDSKIAANNALAKTLEDIAQTIFKSWFIDFDPVKAKMAGQEPVGMDAETAALFPDSMEESKLGLIPMGWTTKRFGDLVIKQKVGRVFSSKESFGNGRVPILDQKDSGKVGFHNESPGYIASPDEPVVVFGNHTCVIRLIPYEFSVVQNVFPLLSDHADVFWLYFALQGKQDYEGYKGHWPDFIVHKTAIPPKEMTLKFGELVKPLFKLKWSLESEAATVEEVRDALLPRLISGELQIPEETLAS